MSRTMYSRNKSWVSSVGAPIWIYIIALILVLGISMVRPINKASNRREVTVTVTDKGIKNKSDEGKYLIYTKTASGNIEVFEITDSFFAWRWNSSDVYAGIEVGETYVFEVGGSRNEFFSWYPNIYSYRKVSK